MKKKIVSWLLIICLILTLAPIGQITVNAVTVTTPAKVSTTTVNERIKQLRTLEGKYFTTDGTSCNGYNHQSYNHSKCNVKNVLSNNSTVRKLVKSNKGAYNTSTYSNFPMHYYNGSSLSLGDSCCGFVSFAGWYIFSTKYTDKVTTKQIAKCIGYNESNMKKYIKPGDLLRLDGAHSAIALSVGSDGVKVLNSNFANNRSRNINKITVDTIYYSTYNYVGISRASNYSTSTSTKTINPTGISLNTTSKKMGVGSICYLTATVSPSNATNKTVTWSSSNKKVATVSSSGTVTAVGKGSATITAKTSNGKKTTCKITVVSASKSTSTLRLSSYTSGPSSTVKKGTSVYIKGKVNSNYKITAVSISIYNSSNKRIQYGKYYPNAYSADLSKADVGKIYFSKLATGSYTMYIKATDKTQTKTLKKVPFKIVSTTSSTVNASSVTLNYGSIACYPGNTYTLKATVAPSNATNKNVTWSSSNTNVAKVSTSGVVTAVAAGSATITVKTHNGKTATCTVTVKSNTQPVASTLQLASYTSGPGASIVRGTSVYIKGSVKSNYKISNVNISILNSSGQTIQSGSYNPNAYTADLSKADVGYIYFSKLPTGKYTMKITATDQQQTKVLKNVTFNIYNTVLYNYSGVPSSIKKGTSVYIKGTFKSYHKITAVSISIYNSKNTRIQYGRYFPNAYSADLSKADVGSIYFSKLAKGNYKMVVKATTTAGTFTFDTKNFTVK